MTDATRSPVLDGMAPDLSGSEAERQVVGICLRYRGAAESLDLRGDDFSDRALGRLFEACRLIPDPPAAPAANVPDFVIGLAGHIPMPATWAAWLEVTQDWRPRQASRLVMSNPDFAIGMHDSCGLLGSLPRWAKEVESAALLRKYRLACSYAIQLVDQGAEPEEIKAVLSGMA